MNESNSFRFFIAGIMQGSRIEAVCHDQNYRSILTDRLRKFFPNATVYDPYANHQESLNYSFESGRQVFLTHNKMCGAETDALIAFLPEASMGTAIEMWEAWKNGAAIISISPMVENWVVKFLSDAIYPSLNEFNFALETGEISSILENSSRRQRPIMS